MIECRYKKVVIVLLIVASVLCSGLTSVIIFRNTEVYLSIITSLFAAVFLYGYYFCYTYRLTLNEKGFVEQKRKREKYYYYDKITKVEFIHDKIAYIYTEDKKIELGSFYTNSQTAIAYLKNEIKKYEGIKIEETSYKSLIINIIVDRLFDSIGDVFDHA